MAYAGKEWTATDAVDATQLNRMEASIKAAIGTAGMWFVRASTASVDTSAGYVHQVASDTRFGILRGRKMAGVDYLYLTLQCVTNAASTGGTFTVTANSKAASNVVAAGGVETWVVCVDMSALADGSPFTVIISGQVANTAGFAQMAPVEMVMHPDADYLSANDTIVW